MMLAIGIGTIAVVVLALWAIHDSKRREVRVLRDCGRTCEWDDALRWVRSGRGLLIINRTNLPGKVWWTPLDPDGVPVAALLSRSETLLTDFSGSMTRIAIEAPADRVVEAHGIVRH